MSGEPRIIRAQEGGDERYAGKTLCAIPFKVESGSRAQDEEIAMQIMKAIKAAFEEFPEATIILTPREAVEAFEAGFMGASRLVREHTARKARRN